MGRQTYLEPFLILGVLFLASTVAATYLLWGLWYSLVFVTLSFLSAGWVFGRIHAISRIRAEQQKYFTQDELRAELMRSHSWWTCSQIDELLTRYMNFQNGHYQKWLLDNVRVVQISEEMEKEGVAAKKQP